MDALPEDSTLKRHHVAAALGEILAAMPPRPTDSVLRRHFDASVQSRLVDMVGAEAASLVVGSELAPEAGPSPASAAGSSSAAGGAARDSGGGGLFGWLKRLLGG